jgi:hypothetical protein
MDLPTPCSTDHLDWFDPVVSSQEVNRRGPASEVDFLASKRIAVDQVHG